ncbi:MAG: hypothetical protein JXA74_15360 [Anaerolineae bacterium]|nr:hypothetical protein [Anaerolineae bacterium]
MRLESSSRRLRFLILVFVVTLAAALSARAETETLDSAVADAAVQEKPESDREGPQLPGIEASEDVPPRPIAVKIEGMVTAVDDTVPGTLVVKELAIEITLETRIRPAFLLPQVGDLVVVRAMLEADQTAGEPAVRYVAHYIRVLRGQDTEIRPFQFRGLIMAFPPEPYVGRWTISGLTVVVLDEQTHSGLAPDLGFLAHVEGFMQPDGSVRAVHVQVLKPWDVLNRFDLKGPIQVRGAIPGDWIIGQVRGHVETSTQIEGNPELGLMAEVRGRLGRDGRPIFERIRVLGESEYVRIEGVIQAIHVAEDGFGHWVVGGQIIEVDDQTFVDESRASATLGMWANVTARREASYPYALRIRVERPG